MIFDRRSITMKFRLSVFLAVVMSTVMLASEPESFTVNGLKVIFKQNTSNDIVSARMFFRGGVSVLTSQQAGIENLALDVATKASEHYPKDKLSGTLEKMDSHVSSSSGIDYSSVNLLCVKQYFVASWDVFADVLLHPAMDKEDVDLERNKTLASINQMKDNPDAYLSDLARRAFYTDHPYQTEVDGTVETVSSFTPEQLKAYMMSRMTSSQLLLVVVGNTTRQELEKMVSSSFGSLPVGSFTAPDLPMEEHQAPSMKIVQRTLPTNYIAGYFPAPSMGMPDYYAMTIAGSILRDRLFEEVRTKRGLSYAPSGGVSNSFSNHGNIYVTAVQPDTTIEVMIGELRKIKSEKVSEEDLRDKINDFITRFYYRIETSQSQAGFLAEYELSGAGYQQADKFIDNMKKVTPDDILNACKKYIKNIQFVLIGNPESLHVRDFMF